MLTRFIILFEGRNGSSFVTSKLASHPEVIAIDEPLVGKTAKEQYDWLRKFFDKPRSAIGKKSRLCNALFKSGARNKPVAAGFKTKLRTVEDIEMFRSLIEEYNCKIIHLDRKNIIKQAISGLNGLRLFQLHGRYNLLKGQNELPPFSPTIAELEEEILFKSQKKAALQAFLKELKQPVVTLYYEELLQDQEKFFSELLSFLKLKPGSMHSKLIKSSNDDIRQAILNYGEIKEHFSRKGYEEMFD